MGQAVRQQLTAWLAGEIDPLLSGRTDTDQYAYGLSVCENFACINEGPLVKRAGFFYLNDAAATASWLGAFRFSITQEYAIEWSALKARLKGAQPAISSLPLMCCRALLSIRTRSSIVSRRHI